MQFIFPRVYIINKPKHFNQCINFNCKQIISQKHVQPLKIAFKGTCKINSYIFKRAFLCTTL